MRLLPLLVYAVGFAGFCRCLGWHERVIQRRNLRRNDRAILRTSR